GGFGSPDPTTPAICPVSLASVHATDAPPECPAVYTRLRSIAYACITAGHIAVIARRVGSHGPLREFSDPTTIQPYFSAASRKTSAPRAPRPPGSNTKSSGHVRVEVYEDGR